MATATQSPISQPHSITNGDTHDLPPPTQPAKKAKGKKEKLSAEENAKLVQARLSQLEQEKQGEKTQQAEVDREVKKATRDLNELIHSVKDPLSRIDLLQKKYEELLADMKKLEREYTKTKKRADQQQKDGDKAKTENNKTSAMKDKLEKLCRELTKENKKVKDDNKRLDESEKAARETINERLDQMLYDVQEVMNSKGTTHAENLHLELDELYVPITFIDLHPTNVLLDSRLVARYLPIKLNFEKSISARSCDTKMQKSPTSPPNTKSNADVQTVKPLVVAHSPPKSPHSPTLKQNFALNSTSTLRNSNR